MVLQWFPARCIECLVRECLVGDRVGEKRVFDRCQLFVGCGRCVVGFTVGDIRDCILCGSLEDGVY